MIAVSSAKSHSNEEYAANQKAAARSWSLYFEKVYYFSEPEIDLTHRNVFFLPGEDWPRVKDMANLASKVRAAFTCLINADIFLAPAFKTVEEKMVKGHVKCATSKRWQFDPKDFTKRNIRVADSGLDIFVGTPEVWRAVAERMPSAYRLGHPNWDGWLAGFLNATYKGSFVDFTHLKCVLHPKHEGRECPYQAEVGIKDRFLNHAAVPGRKLPT